MIAFHTVAAQDTEDRDNIAATFKRLDRDGDGRLSAKEAAPVPVLGRAFSAIDADRDGLLSIEEVRASLGGKQRRARRDAPPADLNVSQAEHTLTVDGRERTFITQAPENPRGKLPVVFVFHGGGGRGDGLAARGFGEMVATENFLAVYPTGWKNNWNDGRQAPRIAAQVENVDDVKFVRAMVDDLEKRHSIDRSRVFATGISNGGIFSHCLAAKAADLFAGIAPVVGGLAEPLADGFKPSHPISLLVIQGDADPLVPIGGGAIANDDRGGRVIAIAETLKKYLAHNGITGDPEIAQLPDTNPNDGTTTEVRR
jgi:polyhydroxybutyrate depolymerase